MGWGMEWAARVSIYLFGGSQHMFNDNGSFLLAMFEFFIFLAWFMCL